MKKHKILSVTIILFLVSLHAFSQSRIGLVAGLNSGNFSGDAPTTGKFVSGIAYNMGVGLDIQIAEDLFLSTVPSFALSNSKIQFSKLIEEEDDVVEVYEDSISLKYQFVALPIILKIISDNGKWQFSGGFEVSFPLTLTADNTVEEDDLTDQISSTNINMLFGIGYRIPIKRQLLVINLSYAQGLNNLAKNLDDPDTLLPRVRFVSWRFSAAWLLPIGKNRFSEPTNN